MAKNTHDDARLELIRATERQPFNRVDLDAVCLRLVREAASADVIALHRVVQLLRKAEHEIQQTPSDAFCEGGA